MLNRVIHLILCLAIAMLASEGAYAEDAGQIFQKGLFAEHGAGDLRRAIEFYEEALQNEYEDDELAARILLRLGICCEKTGRDADAKNAYQQVIRRFPAQETASDEAAERLRKLSSGLVGDGYWFRYKGAPIYLIGGGTASIYAGSGLTEDMPATDDPVRDWKAYIDLLVKYRINFVRFCPWDFLNRSEVPDYASPWVVTAGKPTYDLDRFNPEYWAKLREIVAYANSRDILFAIAIFDDDSPWKRHPFSQKCGGALENKSQYHNLGNDRNKEYQEKYVAKTIADTMEFPVVIYEICDAVGHRGQPLSRAMKNWILHWINFIEERLPNSSNHPITVSQNSWSMGKELDELWDLPGIDIISVQENEGTKFALGKEYTRKNFLKYWKSDYQKPIMINETSFGDMKEHPEGGTRGWVEERQHLWMAFASGGYAARSDFQFFGEAHPSLDACLHLANFVREVKFWEMTPLVDFVLSYDGKCYSLGSDEEFVVYIRARTQPKKGKIKLKLPRGNYRALWYDPINGGFLLDAKDITGGEITLRLPKTATDVVLYAGKVREE